MSETIVITGKDTRLSYTHVTSVGKLSGKYETTLLIPKSDKVTYNKLLAAIEAAKEEAKVKRWKGVIPKKFKYEFLQDGDEKTDKDGEPDENYAGHWYLQVRAKADTDKVTKVVTPYLPFLCDKNRVKIEPNQVYSGCYGIASLNVYGYEWEGSKGISGEWRGFQFIRDGEPLGGGGGNAANDFEEFDDEGEI